jgi:pimeloyl-ACP methyl ester carboxylesterase
MEVTHRSNDGPTLIAGAGGVELSALIRLPPGPSFRGLIVALHGGGYSAGYWDCPIDGLSLLGLASELGWAAIALDRPGYGASQTLAPERLGLAAQADIVFDVIESWCAEQDYRGPVALIGHSVGGILALMMAAHSRSARLAAVDVLGVPFRYPASPDADAVHALEPTDGFVGGLDKAARRALLFGPPGSFDEAVLNHDRLYGRPMPYPELVHGLAAPAIWSDVLPRIALPVQISLAEHETIQVTGPELAAELCQMLGGNPRARVRMQRGTGHNASLHQIARAYHMNAIAFFEECLALHSGRS